MSGLEAAAVLSHAAVQSELGALRRGLRLVAREKEWEASQEGERMRVEREATRKERERVRPNARTRMREYWFRH